MRKQLPPLNALRSFECAARHCSFKDAANELCVSLSAISHQIKLLESYLGVALFKRKARAVELTPVGKSYYLVLHETFNQIASATTAIVAPDAPEPLILQLYSTFAIRWLIPRISAFQSRHPDIPVRISTSQQDVDFNHDNVDLCIRACNQSKFDHQLHYEYLFSSEIFPVCSPALLQHNKPLKQFSDLSLHTILQVYPSGSDWWDWLQAHNIDAIDPDAGLQLDSYDHALAMATQGVGVALAMPHYITQELGNGDLIEPFAGCRVPSDSWFLVYKNEQAGDDKINRFQHWLLEEITHFRDTSAHLPT